MCNEPIVGRSASAVLPIPEAEGSAQLPSKAKRQPLAVSEPSKPTGRFYGNFQRAAVAIVLSNDANEPDLFDSDGPSDEALSLFVHNNHQRPLEARTASHRMLLALAWAVWSGSPGPGALDLVLGLDDDAWIALELLQALTEGPEALDQFLDAHICADASYNSRGGLFDPDTNEFERSRVRLERREAGAQS